MEQPKRKRLRLQKYDYSENGAYFITVCVQNKMELFGPANEKTQAAQKVSQVFEQILSSYPQMQCPTYVVMPNHFHALIMIDKADGAQSSTVSKMIQAFKSKTTVEYIRMVKEGKAKPFDKKLWQRSYYDHVIRNEQDFQEVWKYIEENPLQWQFKKGCD